MKFINGYIKVVDKINEKIGVLTSWLTVLLVLVVSYDVFVRYIFGESSVGLQELECHIFALIFLVAAAYTLKVDEHVRVDVFYTRFSPNNKAWLNLLGSIFLLIPFCIIVILASEHFL
jgi:TRAP-type mannitol/chloroaromatic compound transport system permease small subunit